MEEVRRLKQDKQSLEVDLVHMQKERDLAKAQVIHTSGRIRMFYFISPSSLLVITYKSNIAVFILFCFINTFYKNRSYER